MKLRHLLTSLVGGSLLSASALAQVGYTGGAYTQNFDTLANSGTTQLAFTDNVTLEGWYIRAIDTLYAGSGDFIFTMTGVENAPVNDYRVGSGGDNAGDVYSFGSTSATDRALGSVASGPTDEIFIGLALRNDTTSTLSSFDIAYTGEQWRRAGNNPNRPERLWFFYRIGGSEFSGDSTTGWVAVPELDFVSPNATDTTSVALDGNAVGNRTLVSGNILASVAPGETIWFTWVDADNVGTGGDHGMAIDDLSIVGNAATSGAPVVNSPNTITATAFVPFTYTITASGSPTSFGTSTLPAGLTFDSVTGVIGGAATTPGTYPIIVSATNGNGTGTLNVTLNVAVNENAPVINTNQVVSTDINQPFSYQVLASNNPTSWAVIGGALHTGLTLDSSSGVISGTPTVTGTRTITIQASNALGSGSGTISLTVNGPPTSNIATNYAFLEGSTVNITFTNSADTGAFTINNLPPGFETFGGASISGTATTPGVYTSSLVVENLYGSTTYPFTIYVLSQAQIDAIPTNVVVNKWVNATPDLIELLVVGNGTVGSTVDMRGMVIKDFSGSNVNDNGGRVTFTNDAAWSAVPAGTLIVLAVPSGTTALPAEDTDGSDYVLRLNLSNSTYFLPMSGIMDLGTTDMVMIKAANTGEAGALGGIHTLASGVPAAPTAPPAQFAAATGAKLSSTATTGGNLGIIANTPTPALADYTGLEATGGQTLASLTFGAGNNATNTAYIASLRPVLVSAPVITSALTATATVGAPFSYTITADNSPTSFYSSPLPVFLTFSTATGQIAGTAANPGVYNITIRAINAGGQDEETLVLTVTTPLQNWRQAYFGSPDNSGNGADGNDFDNDGLSNLEEYAFGLNPTIPSQDPVTLARTGDGQFLTLTFPRVNDPALNYAVWGTNDLLVAPVSTGFSVNGGTTPTTYIDNVGVNLPNARRFLHIRITY